MTAYYNDNDTFAAAWLRNLISAGLIAPGVVDERSILDVRAADLEGFAQCHFFAGIGGWPLALQLAGHGSARSVWTGSCPCPPFSAAGKRITCPACHGGNLVWCPRRTGFAICADCRHAWFADARHLWPELWRLIAERRPSAVFGEQVASEQGLVWLAGVRGSLEILGYAAGGSDLPACGVGAPNIRQRIFWVADTGHESARRVTSAEQTEGRRPLGKSARRGDASGLAHADGGQPSEGDLQRSGQHGQQSQDGGAGRLGDAERARLEGHAGHVDNGDQPGRQRADQARPTAAASGAGFWDRYAIIPCSDGKSRRVPESVLQYLADGFSGNLADLPAEAGFPLAQAIAGRAGALRGAGNAINPWVAAEFVSAFMECRP